MFKINQNPEFSHKVKVRVPVDGGFTEQEFTARFRVVSWEELKKLDHNPEEQVRKVWVGWGEDVVDDDGNPVPFSNEARDQMIGMLYVRVALLQTYVKAITGAKQGN